ncbi:D-amino-acid:oxygen oxidoreductase [Jatrophihabitans endophyticus]|uniref:D-amino-acid oxidase n=1 Tax=Jatrophihabitans endophyticus TaxID=1206085 RepID=A0A1M5C3T3_9ACTN|nr:D-amino-acid:oxygen oxidoreductase [Jatrophihabitans endophyticus]
MTVVGGGISGLATAARLLADGAAVTVVAADEPAHTTSWLAAAVWFPTHAGPPELVARWGGETFAAFEWQAGERVPGVTMRESLALYREPPGAADWHGLVASLRSARSDELPPGYAHGLRFRVPAIEMPLYLPWLFQHVTDAGGRFVARRLDTLAEAWDVAPADVVVHCAGLAAGRLTGDDSVYPVRGQIVRVPNPGVTMSVRDEAHPAGRAYVHPRSHDCILGGTLDEGRWDTEPDAATTASILRRCADLVPALAGARPIEAVAGLRPGRPTVRLAVEQTDRGPVVHNYGHGGSGVTLAWGCAAAAAALVTATTVPSTTVPSTTVPSSRRDSGADDHGRGPELS